MAYIADRVVICDASCKPDKHYQLLPGGQSKPVHGRRYVCFEPGRLPVKKTG